MIYKNSINQLIIPLFITFLLVLKVKTSPNNFYFNRNISCIKNSPQQCLQWNQTTIMMVQYMWGVSTYHAHTLVHTLQQGPKQMQHLNIGQKILAYDYHTGKNHFMPMKAWFIRDSHALIQLHKLVTKQGHTYMLNINQNLAVMTHLNQKQKYFSFQQAYKLNHKTQLHAFYINQKQTHSNAVHFSGILQQNQLKHGLFSPYVQGMNFYIYPSEQNQGQNHMNIINKPMILSHCSSNINFLGDHNKKLQNYQHFIDVSISIINHLWFWNFDEKHDLQIQYENPVNHLIGLFVQQNDDQHQSKHINPKNGDDKNSKKVFKQHKNTIKVGHQYSGGSRNNNRQIMLKKAVLTVALLQMNQPFILSQ